MPLTLGEWSQIVTLGLFSAKSDSDCCLKYPMTRLREENSTCNAESGDFRISKRTLLLNKDFLIYTFERDSYIKFGVSKYQLIHPFYALRTLPDQAWWTSSGG